MAWQSDEETPSLRKRSVRKLMDALFPYPYVKDSRIQDIALYAARLEKDLYDKGTSKTDFLQAVAERIYHIKKELDDKKARRANGQEPHPQISQIHQQQQQQQQQMQQIQQQPNSQQGPSNGQAPLQNIENNAMMQPDIKPVIPPQQQQQYQQQLQQQQQQQAHQQAQQYSQQQQPQPQQNNWAHQPNASTSYGQMAPSHGQDLKRSSTGSETSEVPNKQIKTEPFDSASTPPALENASIDMKPDLASMSESKVTPPAQPTPAQNNNTQRQRSEPPPPPKPSKPSVDEPPGEDTVHDAESMKRHLMPVFTICWEMEEAVIFHEPVDPIKLGIPQYADIIKQPMDLSTIRNKLNRGGYANPWQFCEDMWLMFDNAWTFNKKATKVYKQTTKVHEIFTLEMNVAMEKMGYCCSQRLTFTELPLFCYGAGQCLILWDQPYMCYEQNSCQFNIQVSEKYTYCLKCFDSLVPPEGMALTDDPNDQNRVKKDAFQLMKNNQREYEPMEVCKLCHRKWHKICANYHNKIYTEGFTCETCLKEKELTKQENKFTAKKLPHTKLSQHLEDRVNGYVKRTTDEELEVVIRVLSVQEKEVEVRKEIRDKYSMQGFPDKFPYRSKAIFAFEVIDGAEVCFFGMHVQEYDNKCGGNNQRRVYIAYLDSVNFFQPRTMRTDVYHEILLGYLDYAKQLGYTMAHLWACPPGEGDDYIFHCHPPDQKMPKPKRLQDWYRCMLTKGKEQGVVVEFKDIYKQAVDDDLRCPIELPYFEGDFWPGIIEECIRDAKDEETKRLQGGDDEDDIVSKSHSKKKSTKASKNKKKPEKTKQSTGDLITDKLYTQLEKHKDVFFTIRLVPEKELPKVHAIDIADPDRLLASELMENRDNFLQRAREDHWEFSSLRRAKYSTLCMCHALHNDPGQKDGIATCNLCNATAKWHCNTCEDFDMCDKCKEAKPHKHPLEKIAQLVDGGTNGEKKDKNGRLQACAMALQHACQCRDANCNERNCQKMKKVVQHTKTCKKRMTSDCQYCKQLIALCCYHAKNCHKEQCPIPYCSAIRHKLNEQKQSQVRRSEMMMRRRMEGIRGRDALQHQLSQSQGSPTGMEQSPATNGPGSINASKNGGPGSVGPGSNKSMHQQQMMSYGAQQQAQQQQPQSQHLQQHGAQKGGAGSYMPMAQLPAQGQYNPMMDQQNRQMYGMQQQQQAQQQMHQQRPQAVAAQPQRQVDPRVQGVVRQFNSLKGNPEERERMLGELKKQPPLFQAFIKEIQAQRDQQQPPPPPWMQTSGQMPMGAQGQRPPMGQHPGQYPAHMQQHMQQQQQQYYGQQHQQQQLQQQQKQWPTGK
ncbi:unnamed protein product, partial [Mesorhabditis spiculigera]